MPNGGPDNCARCGINRANNGHWPGPGEENELPGVCTIRGFAIGNPHWTYCKNQHSREPRPMGPVYGSVYTRGYQRVPWYMGRGRRIWPGAPWDALGPTKHGTRAITYIDGQALEPTDPGTLSFRARPL